MSKCPISVMLFSDFSSLPKTMSRALNGDGGSKYTDKQICVCMPTACMFNGKVAKAIDLECIGNGDYLNRPHKQTHRASFILYHIMEMCLSIVIFNFFCRMQNSI